MTLQLQLQPSWFQKSNPQYLMTRANVEKDRTGTLNRLRMSGKADTRASRGSLKIAPLSPVNARANLTLAAGGAAKGKHLLLTVRSAKSHSPP